MAHSLERYRRIYDERDLLGTVYCLKFFLWQTLAIQGMN